ncbi:hypothetical protein D3C73_720150 [compost metagenome]
MIILYIPNSNNLTTSALDNDGLESLKIDISKSPLRLIKHVWKSISWKLFIRSFSVDCALTFNNRSVMSPLLNSGVKKTMSRVKIDDLN